MPAHVIEAVTPAMPLFREESFGPVVAVVRAGDEADAIALANDTEYGFSASVFTRDTARGPRVARRIRSGVGLRQIRRQRWHRQLYRTALDHD